jgi:uncharacterized membrane protein YgcG
MAKDKSDTNIEVYIEKVRLSHPHLWVATTFKGDKNARPKYQASFIVDPQENKKAHDAIWDAIDGVQDAKWEDSEYCELAKLPYVDGDKKNKKKFREEYKGMFILTAKNDRRPQVLDRDKTPLTKDDPIPYAGCFVDALVRIYALDNEWGERVNCSLEIVRFHKDGTAFGPEPADPDNMPDLPPDGEKSGRSLARGGRDSGDDDRGSRRGGRDSGDDDRGSRRGGRDGDSSEGGGARRGRGSDEDSRGGRGSAERGRGGDSDDRGSSRRGSSADEPRGRGRDDDAPRRGGRDDAPRERSGGGRRSVNTDDVV